MRRKVQVGIAALLMLVAAASATVWIDHGSTNLASAQARERVYTTSIFAAAVGGWLESAESQAETIASALDPWTGSPEQSATVRGRLDGLLSTAGPFDDGAVIVNRELQVIAAVSPKQGLVGLTRNLPNIQAAFNGATSFSGAVEDPLDRVAAITVATPLRDGPAVTGALVLGSRINGGSFGRILEQLRESSGAVPGAQTLSVFVVGPSGEPIPAAGPTQAIEKDSADVTAAVAQSRSSGDSSGSFRFEGRAGIMKVAAFVLVDPEWIVVSLEDETDFNSGLNTSSSPRAAVVLLIAVAAGMMLFVWLWRRLNASELRSEEAKQEFLAVTGHELRTPLTVIRGYSQTLVARWPALGEAQKLDLVQTISRHARILDNLIDRLILASQLEAGLGVRSPKRPTDIARSLQNAIAQQSSLTDLHRFELDIEQPLIAEAEVKSVEQIFEQLIENAVKYSPGGGTIRVTGRRVNGTVEVTVEDEGVGLPSDISGIFDKFVQGETAGTRVHDEGGVGLGLFIARRQLEALGGGIRAERREPGGARFVVTLRANPTE